MEKIRDRINGETGAVEGARGILGRTGEDRAYSEGATSDSVYISDGELDVMKSCAEGTDTVYFVRDLDQVDRDSCESLVPRRP